MKKKLGRIAVILLLVLLFVCFFYYDLSQFLTFEYLKSQREELQSNYQQNPLLFCLAYLGVYISIAALSLPGAVILTLAAGVIFGTSVGVILVSFASTVGATLAFLASRFLSRDSVERKFHSKLKAINEGIDRDGALYLFSLRLILVFETYLL